MPSRDKIAARKVAALRQIEAITQQVGGNSPLDFTVRHRNSEMRELLMLEQIAAWLSENLGDTPPAVPLEHLTTDGLRWLAEQRGVDVSEFTKKQEIIDALEG